MAPRKLLLFDIDGTLLDTGGAGLSALESAMRKTFSIESDFPEIELAGSTDSGIVKALFAHFGIPESPEAIEALYAAYLPELRAKLDAPGSPARLLPGIQRLLDAIRHETGHITALLTGNIQRGAFIKVGHFGIDHHFKFGAFGDDHHDRNALGPVALRRAMDHHDISFEPRDVVVIGDTPKDIHCARAINACAIIVATGSFSRDQLRAHGPHHLFEHFEETAAVMEAIDAT